MHASSQYACANNFSSKPIIVSQLTISRCRDAFACVLCCERVEVCLQLIGFHLTFGVDEMNKHTGKNYCQGGDRYTLISIHFVFLFVGKIFRWLAFNLVHYTYYLVTGRWIYLWILELGLRKKCISPKFLWCITLDGFSQKYCYIQSQSHLKNSLLSIVGTRF